ncbi:MAG: hypothetical protein IJR87_01820 [Bacteroidaceae bacterium]|nr:hypothetical protein [Bacteroidaceae bacterium]
MRNLLFEIILTLCCTMPRTAFAEVDIVQVFKPERHQRGDTNVSRLQDIDDAHWIWHPTAISQGGVGKFAFLRFRREFTADNTPLRFDVSADERFILLLDGEPVSFGPHRGMVENWLYQSYEAKLSPGRHVMEAVVWVMGPHAPSAQLSWRGGFILKAEGSYHEQLTTGVGGWSVAELRNVKMRQEGMRHNYGVGSQCEVRGCSLMDEQPAAGEYVAPVTARGPVSYNDCGIRTKGWMLFPTPLPDQTYDRVRPGQFRAARATFDRGEYYKEEDARHPMVKDLNALLRKGRPVTIPAHTVLCALLDLDDYYCAYPELVVGGGNGSEVRWMWVEGPKDENKHKGNRNEFVGKNCSGPCDRFFPDGREQARMGVPWWRAGRWCQLEIKTTDNPLVLRDISIIESRYPTPIESHFHCDDASLDGVQKVCLRGMQMDTHETLCDGPHYEQQMYVGDTYVQAGTMAVMYSDDRLIRRAISLFDYERRDNGMLPMNFPTVGTQESATYTMIWPMLLDSYMMWHENAQWLRARMPGLAHTIMGLAEFENEDGLLENLPGWSFIDWVQMPKDWSGLSFSGLPQKGIFSPSNLFYVLSLQAAAHVARQLGYEGLAQDWQARAERLGRKLVAIFWDESSGMIADTPERNSFSQHAQCLAMLAGILSSQQEDAAFRALIERTDIAVATDYFRYYLFQVLAKKGRMDLFMKKMDFWRDHVKWGIRCPLEDDDFETKSDCHAWAAHPLYFLHSAVAGVSPAEPWFKSVRIAPQPGGLKWIDAATPHPRGMILTKLRFEGDRVTGTVTLPDSVSGTFEWKGRKIPLKPGTQTIE